MHISFGNWICRHSGKDKGRNRDQGHPEARALPEKVEMKMEDKYHPDIGFVKGNSNLTDIINGNRLDEYILYFLV